MHSKIFFPDLFSTILYLGSLFQMPFPNGKSFEKHEAVTSLPGHPCLSELVNSVFEWQKLEKHEAVTSLLGHPCLPKLVNGVFEWQKFEKHEVVTSLPGHLYPPEFVNGISKWQKLEKHKAVTSLPSHLCPPEFCLPIDGLHVFRHNCPTTFLPIYDVNEKYLSYISVIFHRYYCLKLISAFRGIAHRGVSYCQIAFMGSMHFAVIA